MKRISVSIVSFVALVTFAPLLAGAPLIGAAATANAASSATTTTSSSPLPGVVGGGAYAGYLMTPAGSSVATVGPLFPVGLGCSTSPTNKAASAFSMSLSKFASSGSLADTIVTGRTATTAGSRSSSTVQKVKLLGGLIAASDVTAIAASKATTTSASSTNHSSFTGLVVAGHAISGTVSPNSVVKVPGIGYVVLNEQLGPRNGANSTSISVTAIDVHVTQTNALGLATGSRILVAHAESSFTRTSFPAVVNADAYGLFSHGAGGSLSATSGPWARAGIGCTGGSDTVSLASVKSPQVVTGTMVDYASGQLTNSSASATGASTTRNVSLLGGIVKAGEVTSLAHVLFTKAGGAAGSTSLQSGTISGVPAPSNPPPNTRINISGIGYVVLNEQHKSVTGTKSSMRTNAIDIYVTMKNALGLPIGARIVVGHSFASVRDYA